MFPSLNRRKAIVNALTICLSLLTQRASCQVVGCDVLECDGGASNGCTLGNTTSSFIGTANFTTSISPSNAPLTWTVGASSSDQNPSSSTSEFTSTKNFYLGTPPSIDLASTSNFAGCALFFEGIARSLPVNGSSEYGSVTCSQALQDACVNDLLSQAKQQIQKVASSGDTKSVCTALQTTLEASPPHSCQWIATVTWGSIVAKGEMRSLALIHSTLLTRCPDITGSQSGAGSHISQTTCHPASDVPSGTDYNIALVESQTVTSGDVSSDIAPFFYSLTPILTVLYDPSGSSSNSLPEAHLTCLKVVEDSTLVQPDVNGASGMLTSLPRTTMALILALSTLALL